MSITATTSSINLQAKLFRSFADPSRPALLEALRDCGLVTVRLEGRFAYYSLSDDRVAQLLLLTDELLVDAAKDVYECRHDNGRISPNG